MANSNRPRSLFARLYRLVRLRLIVPLKRARHSPVFTARGVMIGNVWAWTPTIGIQMYLVFVTWLVARKAFRYHFNLVVALAWTFLTNIFNLLPIYYAFYLTGQVMLGRWDDLSGYRGFVAGWEQAFGADADAWTSVTTFLGLFAADQGLTMLIGSLPWSAGLGWLGYRWSLRYLEARAAARRRRDQRRAAPAAPTAPDARSPPQSSPRVLKER